MTLAKQPPEGGSEGGESGGCTSRPLSSFQPVRTAATTVQEKPIEAGLGEAVPPIPEPDYSSDEGGADDADKKKKSKEAQGGDHAHQNGQLQPTTTASVSSSSKPGSSEHPAVKLTSTATVVFRSSSPVPGAGPAAADQTITTTSSNDQQAQKNGTNTSSFTTRNMFEELREQSAKITNSARARFATDGRQNSTTATAGEGDQGSNEAITRASILKRGNSQEGSDAVSNVMKNVAEFEKRLVIGGGVKEKMNGTAPNGAAGGGGGGISAADLNTMRMSKSCIEELHAANSLKRGGKLKGSSI